MEKQMKILRKKIIQLTKDAEETTRIKWKCREKINHLLLNRTPTNHHKILNLKNQMGRADSEVESFEDSIRMFEAEIDRI